MILFRQELQEKSHFENADSQTGLKNHRQTHRLTISVAKAELCQPSIRIDLAAEEH